MRKWLALALTITSGCSKCGAPTLVPDPGLAMTHRQTDLRSVMMTAYPEFRGARLVSGTALMIRTLDRPAPLDEPTLEVIRKNGFEISLENGKLTAVRKPFTLQIDGPKLVLSMPIVDSDVGKLLGTPSPLTTEQLVLWFPKVPGARIVDEEFRLPFSYEASAKRASYLAWQMVDLNTQSSWKVDQYPEDYERTRRPDGGGGAVPDEFSLRLVDRSTEATLTVHRKGGLVDVVYALRTEQLR